LILLLRPLRLRLDLHPAADRSRLARRLISTTSSWVGDHFLLLPNPK
jgi:hypothetical protein